MSQPSPIPVALVTGATSGIGAASARALARAGHRLALVGRDAVRGEGVAAEIRDGGGVAAFLAADLRDDAGIARAHDFVLDRFGRLDVAFNNAGFQEPRRPLLEQPEAIYDAVFSLNLRSVFLSMQRQIAIMREAGGGAIVNNASVSGVRNVNPGFALYSASKAALLSLTRSAAIEHAAAGIRINAVSPGRIETPMMLASGVAEAAAAALPIRRLGTPEEVAAAVVFLASPAAAFVIGHNLAVDGGFLAG
jgi:NAD(P)-dependent dehydrogenase (short-subunit alcohol dehydrogenase family)